MRLMNSIPLTASQKARLIFDCVPFLFWLVALILCLTVLSGFLGEKALLIALFCVVIMLVVGHRALQRLRDLSAGAAVVEVDLLKDMRRINPRGNPSGAWIGEFEQLGRLNLTRSARPAHPGQRYRVVYSPASKLVWTLEPTP
jgi:hypothetical protein